MKKYIIAILIAAILSVLIGTASMLSCVELRISQSSIENADSVLSSVALIPVNAEMNSKLEYRVKADDAQLYIDGINAEIAAIVVDFSEPLPLGTRYQLYYSANGSGLDEGSSILGEFEEDTDLLTIKLPSRAYYDRFRLDIDVDYKIENIATIDGLGDSFERVSYLSSAMRGESAFPVFEYLICFIILACEALLVVWKWNDIKRAIRESIEKSRNNKANLLRAFVIYLAFIALACFTWLLMDRIGIVKSASELTPFYFVCIGTMTGLLVLLFCQIDKAPEIGFLIISICIGLMFAVMEPAATEMTWDDETHYARAIRLSYGNTSYITEPEDRVARMTVSNEVSLENNLSVKKSLNDLEFRSHGEYKNNCSTPFYVIISYLPSAGLIWLTRLLGLPFTSTVIAGRIGNLLCYAIVMYFAIKQLKYGKILAVSLCMFPTILYLAGNYSYDPFCIAFIALGLFIWLGVWQCPDAKMTAMKAAVMLGSLAIGILPKTVYFPMALIVLFLPENRFESKGAAKRYRWAVVLTVIFLMMLIAVPFLVGNNSRTIYSDPRGGANVDAKSQMTYILSNPIWYAGMLLRFLFGYYFNPTNMLSDIGGCVYSTAYIAIQGVTFSSAIACVYLTVTFVAWLFSFDITGNRREGVPLLLKAIVCIICFGTISIAATSLYCAYNEIGSDFIAGFQERYMLPVVIPLLMIIRPSVALKKHIRTEGINSAIVCVEAVFLTVGMWSFAHCFI